MPKSNLCKSQEDPRIGEITFWIFGEQRKARIPDEVLAKKTGINISTLRKRRAEPESIRLKELWKLIDVLKPLSGFEEKILMREKGGKI